MMSIFTPATTMLTTEQFDGVHVVKFTTGWEIRPLSDQELKFSGQLDNNGLFHVVPISLSTKRMNNSNSSKLMDVLHEFLSKSSMEASMRLSFMCTLSVFIMFNTNHTDPDRFHFTCLFGQPCCNYRMYSNEPIYILPVRDRSIKLHFAVSETGPEAVIIGRMISK